MAKRGIFFIRAGFLCVLNVEVTWDSDAMKYNKFQASKELCESAKSFMHSCIDVSSSSIDSFGKSLNVYNVKDVTGMSIVDSWKVLDAQTQMILPPGTHDILYLKCLNEKQMIRALSAGSFYDIFYNQDKKVTSAAKCCAVLQLLWKQNKLDYIDDVNKFLWWYWINCRNPIEYNERLEEWMKN